MKLKTEVMVLLLLGNSGSVYAVDWYYSPSVNVTERYIDNLRLQISPVPRGNFITTLSPSIKGGYIGDESELYGSFNWNQLFYTSQPDLDFGEKIGYLKYLFKGEKFSGNVLANYGAQATLGSEYIQLGATGSGILSPVTTFKSIQVAQFTRMISPELDYQIDEKNSLQLSGSYIDANFGAHPSVGLSFSDYTSGQGSLTGIHAYSEKLSFNLSGSYSNYQSHNNIPQTLPGGRCGIVNGASVGIYNGNCNTNLAYQQNSDTYSAQLGFNYAPIETWSFTGSIGMRATQSHTNELTSILPNQLGLNKLLFNPLQISDTNKSGNNYSASVKKQFEKGSLSLAASQILSPASTGTQQQVTTFTLTGNYNFTERWSAGLNTAYLMSDTISTQNNTLSGTPSSYNRTVTSFSPSLQWQWTADVQLQFMYLYIDQNYTATNQTATSNTLQMQFIYQPSINRQVK